jgi:hypothetical protein
LTAIRALLFGLVSALCFWASPAHAWDSQKFWYAPAHGADPGGGGILGTGSQADYGIQCLHCHIEPEENIDLTFTPTPAFENDGDVVYYEPGTEYEFTVNLLGEYLGLDECPEGGFNYNFFVATFEDAAGNPIGTLASDGGQVRGGNCPEDPPARSEDAPGTTIMYSDCRAVIARDLLPIGTTQWSFSWTAPPAGTGDVTLFGGGVDSNCDMFSMNDDVKMVKLTLSDGSERAQAFRAPGGGGPLSQKHSPFGSTADRGVLIGSGDLVWLTSGFLALALAGILRRIRRSRWA